MNIFWTNFLSCFIVIFAIINLMGNLPFILRMEKEGKKIVPIKAAIFGFTMLILFFYVGEAFLNLFGVDFSSFAVAGSMVIFIIGIEMMLDIHIFSKRNKITNDVTMMPIVFPMLIGVGTFTTVLSLRAQFPNISILLAIFANICLMYLVLKLSYRLEKWLNPAFLYTVQKFSGVLLMAISVKIFTTNVMHLIHSLS